VTKSDFKEFKEQLNRDMKKIGDQICSYLEKHLDNKLKKINAVSGNRFVCMEGMLASAEQKISQLQKEFNDIKQASATADKDPTLANPPSTSLARSIREEMY
jgi:BMFP domain-containing protein YqiC